jgi:hypothetical protein
MIRNGKVACSPRVSLHSGASISDAWQVVILPWFKRTAANSWETNAPSAIAVPSRSHAHFFRARLLQDNVPLLGVHFLTPGVLREIIFRGSKITVPKHEHLRLLLAIAAERDENIAAKSFAQAPDHLLRAMNQVSAAGWSFAELAPPFLRGLTQRFEQLRRECGFHLTAEADRLAFENISKVALLFHDLLVVGFNGAHWPMWFLLQAAVHAAAKATVVLSDPRDEARDLDETWIGSWEEKFGAAAPIAVPRQASETLFPDLFEPEQSTVASPRKLPPPLFIVGRDTTEQAQGIVALTEQFLADPAAERIGILFPRAGSLPRLVASLLSDGRLPHGDNLAHPAPGPLEEEAWQAWLDLQENPRLRMLIRFLHALPEPRKFFGDLDLDKIEKILRRAFGELLLDDLELIRAYCARCVPTVGTKIDAGLTALGFLPERATFDKYLALTQKIFHAFAWSEQATMVEQASRAWRQQVPNELSRTIYLRWLSEVSASFFSARDPLGDQPYSRVQLLLYTQAEGQEWSHLIFAGLNEGSWPPLADESGFLSEEEIGALNTRVRDLNRRAVRQGSQGEGHSVVAEGKTFCLGAVERRQLVARQFSNLCEAATVAIAASANLIEESAPERLANPSEFFTRLYFDARSEGPSQRAMAILQQETRAWLQERAAKRDKTMTTDMLQTGIAYVKRRGRDTKFGEYEFALRESSAGAVSLSATDWEKTIKTPALIWMRRFLGVEANEDEFVDWNLAVGQWVHRWLARIANGNADGRFIPQPQADDVRPLTRAAADEFHERISTLRGKPLPDWWLSGWKHAVFVADALATIIATTEGWPSFATEWTLPSCSIRLSKELSFPIKGRIDLLLARKPREDESLPFTDLWVIDYKTGRRTSLAQNTKSKMPPAEDFRIKILQGKGLQLALYALALRELGAIDIAVSLLTRDLELDRPQVAMDVIAAQQPIWEELARMSASGVFGMRGELRPGFEFQDPYPLATLAIDPDLLEEKWTRTHPALPKTERET